MSNDIKGKRILLISPEFHSYRLAIINEFKSLNTEIESITYENNNSIFNVLRHFKILRSYIENILTIKRYNKLSKKDFNYIIIIRAGLINSKTLNYIKKENQDSKTILYLWDSVEENPSILKIKDFFDSIKSFDPKDCNNMGFEYLPLFYTHDFKIEKSENAQKLLQKYDLAFVGRDHSDRFKILSKLKAQAHSFNLSYNFILVTSKIGFIKRKILNYKEFKNAKWSDFSFKTIPFSKIADIYRESKCIIDIEQKVQSGLTMRTFELLASGKKMITTNNSIKETDLYASQNVLIIDRNNPTIDLEFIHDKVLYNSNIEKYSITNWVQNIIK